MQGARAPTIFGQHLSSNALTMHFFHSVGAQQWIQ